MNTKLHISCWVCQWNNCENRLKVEVMTKTWWSTFWPTLYRRSIRAEDYDMKLTCVGCLPYLHVRVSDTWLWCSPWAVLVLECNRHSCVDPSLDDAPLLPPHEPSQITNHIHRRLYINQLSFSPIADNICIMTIIWTLDDKVENHNSCSVPYGVSQLGYCAQ